MPVDSHAGILITGGGDAGQDKELPAGCFDGKPRPDERGQMVIYEAMCDLLCTLRGLIQHGNGNPAVVFRAYANKGFSRCRAPMPSPGSNEQVAAGP